MNESIRQEFAEGLLYAHSQLNGNIRGTLEAPSFLYALVELLTEGGLVSADRQDMSRAQEPPVGTNHIGRAQ